MSKIYNAKLYKARNVCMCVLKREGDRGVFLLRQKFSVKGATHLVIKMLAY